MILALPPVNESDLTCFWVGPPFEGSGPLRNLIPNMHRSWQLQTNYIVSRNIKKAWNLGNSEIVLHMLTFPYAGIFHFFTPMLKFM